ncbi:flagellar hook-length control protein FliK [Bradyrhizobium sp. Arg237L]|uniref:flagellar hook-length control protein FliK n=1 Tax=Bradyrhizobium sp. Arg237L TaxID=3003352 RepID=UPI00249ED183|nr:flagellar hook-length control protein FliK [Bradyrhizobium sp. Arg237L]MDI4236818.1 flagellar hook-length control protein FliK [Bradyrhizobium sp. Arg237L]
MSFQANSPRSARPDSGPAPGNDSFAALVDSNTAARDDRPDDSSRPPPAPARRNDDPAPAADTRSRDDGAGPDRPERNDVDARNDAGSSGRADKPDHADSKSDTPKSDSAKSSKPKDDAPAKDDAKDGDESKQDDGTAATTVIAATASAVVASPANAAPPTPPVSDPATAPLATAAAAIAAVASVAGTAPAAADAVKADAQAEAQADAKAVAVSDSAEAVEGTAIGIALSAAAPSPTPQTKATTQSKPTLTAKDAIPTSSAQDNATDSAPAETPTGIVPDIAPPEAAAGKQKAEHAFVDAVKADASGNSARTPAAHAASHVESGAANPAQTLAAASDNAAQAAAMIQPQMPSTPTTPSANAQLTVTAATTHGNAVPVSGLALEIAASAKSGKSQFEIRLDPPELGRIDVRIHVDNHGQVTSHLTVERPETLQMLRQDANQLQRALDNAGLSTGNSGLQFSLRDQSSSGQNGGNQSNPNAHRLIVSEEDSVPATVAGRSYGRMLGASGGVDIRV